MMERQKGQIIFCCDSCDDFFETEVEDFESAKLRLDAEDWRSYRLGGEWCHACPKCRNKKELSI